MNKETIEYKSKKVIKNTKKDGSISYSQKGVYIGTDSKTGKSITKTVTAKTLRQLDRKIIELKLEFESNGSTVKTVIKVSNLAELAEAWFTNYKTW
ncbi:site-specific integrase, partial [Streptococcus suis]|nr:site-specific integrase [Streptococcus suis]